MLRKLLKTNVDKPPIVKEVLETNEMQFISSSCIADYIRILTRSGVEPPTNADLTTLE